MTFNNNTAPARWPRDQQRRRRVHHRHLQPYRVRLRRLEHVAGGAAPPTPTARPTPSPPTYLYRAWTAIRPSFTVTFNSNGGRGDGRRDRQRPDRAHGRTPSRGRGSPSPAGTPCRRQRHGLCRRRHLLLHRLDYPLRAVDREREPHRHLQQQWRHRRDGPRDRQRPDRADGRTRFTRSGFTFAGWNTAANGTGTAYADGATYASPLATMFAQWTAITDQDLTFDNNGGSGTMATRPTTSRPR